MTLPRTIANATPIRFEIVDTHTKRTMGRAKTRAAASRSVDKRDNAYGGYRFKAVPVYALADTADEPYQSCEGDVFSVGCSVLPAAR